MNKYIFITLLSLIILAACKNEINKTAEASAEIKFEKAEHNFGTIDYDSDGRCHFEFTNTGKDPLMINNVRTTCGCTRPEWPEEPVMPGEKGRIGITYNTKVVGSFTKAITVYSNTPSSPTKLFVKGTVEPSK
jgi:Protein of unknown function (DUF1573)